MIAKRPAERLSAYGKCLLTIGALLALTTVALGQAPGPVSNKEVRKQAVKSLMNHPLGFEVNQGQTDSRVKYFAKGNGYTLFLTANGAVISAARKSSEASAIHMQLLGANQHAQIEGVDRSASYSNYYIGNNPQNWHTHVAQYGRVNYRNLYSGVDMAFHGSQMEGMQSQQSQSALEFDFVVAPHASPEQIALQFSGAEPIKRETSGDLLLRSSTGDVRLHKPIAYQEKNGSRVPVDARFVVSANQQVSFALGNYDRSLELVIDPVLGYSTYLGGSAEDEGFGIAVDSAGNAYVTGKTASSGFPPNALAAAPAGGFDAFVTKVNANGTLAFSDYLGGTLDDSGNAIAVDGSGNIYVAGGTRGSGFPTTSGAYQTSFQGGASDAFVAKLDNTGTLQYSTYLGGTGDETAAAIALGSNHNVYVTGTTNSSTSFPQQNAIQSSNNGTSNAFVSELSLQGNGNSDLLYSTYLGGSGADNGKGIAVDTNGNVYLAGDTTSADFPTTAGAFQTECGGGATNTNCNGGLQDGFIAKLKTDGSALVYGTFLGGSDRDFIKAIALDAAGAVYVTGSTISTDFPEKNALQAGLGGVGAQNAFITKLTLGGNGASDEVFSTYFGGSGFDTGWDIAVDSSLQNIYVTGQTSSSDFPLQSALTGGGALQGASDAFITEIKADGSAPILSTYFGGTADEDQSSGGIAVDTAGNIYVTGDTDSTANDLPLQAAAQSTFGGGTSDAFVAQITGVNTPDYSVAAGSASVAAGASGTATVTATSLYGFSEDVALTCSAGLPAGASCSFGPATLNSTTTSSTLTITADTSTPAGNSTVTIRGTSSPGNVVHTATLALSVQDFSLAATAPALVVAGASTPSTVTVTPANGFTGDVTLTCSLGLPAGASCAFSPSPVTGGTGTSTLTISTSASTPAGISTVTVTGTSGSVSHTTTLSLNVQAAPDFEIAASSPITVIRGNSATSTVTIASANGFTSDVALSCSPAGLPLGASCSFAPSTVTGGNGTSTLTISTSSTLTTGGTYSVTITGTAGSLTRTTTVDLEVEDFTLQTTPADTNPGSSITSDVYVYSVRGFSGNVVLTCSAGVPTGASCAFAPPIDLGGGTELSILTINTSASTPTGSSQITVTATSGSLVHTTMVDLGVWDFTLAASASAATMPGNSTTSTIAVAELGDFRSTVALSCSSGLPAGASCSFAPTPVTPGSGTSVLTINTSASTPVGNSTITITGTDGSLTHMTTVTLNVQAAPVPDFSFSAGAPSSATINAGTSDTSTITATAQNGFATDIVLTCSVAPLKTLGPACNFNPAKITGGNGTATLTISTTAATALLSMPGNSTRWLYAMSLPFGGVLLFGAGFGERKKSRKKNALRALFGALLLCSLMLLAGCGNSRSAGSGGTGGGGGNSGTPGTPSGQYTVTVTGTAGTTVHTTTVNVTVQ